MSSRKIILSRAAGHLDLAQSIWSKVGETANIGPAEDSWLLRAESNIHRTFPCAYIALIAAQNGGSMSPYLVHDVLGIHQDPRSSIDGIKWADLADWSGGKLPRAHKQFVPFAGDGHEWYCFDYHCGYDGESARVTAVDMERLDSGDHQAVRVVSNSFIDFLSSIYSEILVDESDRQDSHCLHNAQSADEVRRLVREGADINQVNKRGNTPLCVACDDEQTEVAIELIRQGADPNILCDFGYKPIFFASRLHIDVVQALLKCGNYVKDEIEVPLVNARGSGKKDVAQLLQTYYDKCDE